jgi:hypothetical protein
MLSAGERYATFRKEPDHIRQERPASFPNHSESSQVRKASQWLIGQAGSSLSLLQVSGSGVAHILRHRLLTVLETEFGYHVFRPSPVALRRRDIQNSQTTLCRLLCPCLGIWLGRSKEMFVGTGDIYSHHLGAQTNLDRLPAGTETTSSDLRLPSGEANGKV